MGKLLSRLLLVGLISLFGYSALAETLEQIISRENPKFKCQSAHFTVGRDGMAYLSSHDYLLRLSLDGKDKFGREVVYATANAIANAGGVVATANGHFAHKVTIYDKMLAQQAELNDFLVSDNVGWDAPAHVEAGASGDFYAIDQHRNRILRISPKGKLITAYTCNQLTQNNGLIEDFRVSEKNECFYIHDRAGNLGCVGFDGKLRWKAPFGAPGSFNSRAFDIDADGTLYILQYGGIVATFTKDGEPSGEMNIALTMPRPVPGKNWYDAFRIVGDQMVVHRPDESLLFEVYDRQTRALKNEVRINHERLAVEYPSSTWEAGKSMPFTIDFSASGRTVRPDWHVWLRPIEAADYVEANLVGDQLQVPADCRGVYLMKVTPETQPVETDGTSEYIVRSFVEIRQADAIGSLTVFTPNSRVFYGRGEAIPFSLELRSPQKDLAQTVQVLLSDGNKTIALSQADLKANAGAVANEIPAKITSALVPGDYLLYANAEKLTCVPQHLTIGEGIDKSAFFTVNYGDYGETYPTPSFWEAPDKVAAYAERVKELGLNLMVDRIGSHLQINNVDRGLPWEVKNYVDTLKKDPLATAPQKVELAPALQQLTAAYGAKDIHEMAILMNNDAGLPLGTGFDNRKPELIVDTLKRATKVLDQYPAFRGWSWSSNWWIFNQRGSNAAETPEEKKAYEEAVKKAYETGEWDPVLDKVANRRLNLAVDAQQLFDDTMNAIDPDLVTSVAAPYRNVESYPPITFSNVEEVDLHIQWEQIGLPYHCPNNVDFYKRPGKKAWGHPEIWNDDGTGGQIMPTLFQMVMRGADGVGSSGAIPNWNKLNDPRVGHAYKTSIYRALYSVLGKYGPWFTSLQKDDEVAIVASGRMFKIDFWKHTTGQHFARLLEAYITCLHAHRPASIIFAEDMTPDSLKKFKAVLVVDQQVEFEPKLAAALDAAKQAGVSIFYDKTCKEKLVSQFKPLDVAFDKLENDPSQAGDDHAYWRFASYARQNLPGLLKALEGVAAPAAETPEDEVLVSRSVAEKGKYFFVVNNTLPQLSPGQLWRMNLVLTNRVPMQVPVALNSEGVVYDVFAMKQVQPQNGLVQADLRCEPARIFAVLPKAIEAVGLKLPASVSAGGAFTWRAAVVDADGNAIEASIPLCVRLTDENGKVLVEKYLAAGSRGVAGQMVAPINSSGRLTIEAVELCSGKASRGTISLVNAVMAGDAAVPANAAGQKAEKPADVAPAENAFGPHVRDMVLAANGSLAVMNTFNWDHNLYAVDTTTGQIKWRQKAGQYFAFAPERLDRGLAVQGFDFESAEGYHLYMVNNNGELERRFALYGVPKRLPHRFVPGIVADNINNFAVPRNGSWVASAGDLGLAVWNSNGSLRWKQDWWKTRRHTARLAAVGPDTLLTVEGMDVTAYGAANGKERWSLTLDKLGDVQKVVTSGDNKTIAMLTTATGGKVFILQNAKVVRAIPTAGSDLCLNADGSLLALANEGQLKLYSISNGLQWIFQAKDYVRSPQFSPDGKRLGFSTDIGSFNVVDLSGKTLFAKDTGTRASFCWLPDGDLILGTWMGAVCRLDSTYSERWTAQLQPAALNMRGKLLAEDGAPTTRIESWTNADPEPKPATPNLLSQVPVMIDWVPEAAWGGRSHLSHDPKLFYDGDTSPPEEPWIDWNYVGFFASTSKFNYLLIDTFNKQLHVTGITLFEDPAHPESWLRDARVEYWDVANEEWVPVKTLLPGSAVHSHTFDKPIDAARWRIVMPFGLVGNLRLGEIVFHGEVLGSSNPDVIANKPVAVLFDEQDDIKNSLMWGNNGLSFKFDGAYSGGRCFQLKAGKEAAPIFRPPFGHVVPNWDFSIAENPLPGQYRYFQFAWKPLEKKAGKLSLRLGDRVVFSGEFTADDDQWHVERVDLWKVFTRPTNINYLGLKAEGSAVAFDQLLLGKTEADLAAYGK